jgi:hypothetical protein
VVDPPEESQILGGQRRHAGHLIRRCLQSRWSAPVRSSTGPICFSHAKVAFSN